MNMLKKAWVDPVGSKLIAQLIWAAIVTVCGAIAIWFYIGWAKLLAFITSIWSWFLDDVSMPRWYMLGLFLCAAVLAWRVFSSLWASFVKPQITVKDYTSDTFYGLFWRWRFRGNYIELSGAYCTACQFQVLARAAGMYSALDRIVYICEHCGKNAGPFDSKLHDFENVVQRSIKHRIDTGEWKKVVEANLKN